MQDGQTQGVPIGPDTSYIVAEIMGSAIDNELAKLLKKPLVGARLVDDYALFFETRAEADRAHSLLARAASDFQVALNDEKTYVEQIRGASKESWVYQLQGLGGATTTEQRREILRFTDLAISIVEERGVPAAARYAATVLARKTIHQKNIDIYVACMLRLIAHNPDATPIFVKAIIGYARVGYKVDKRPLATYVGSVLPKLIDLAHEKEAIWILWLALCLAIKLPDSVLRSVALSACSHVILLARLAEERGLCGEVKQTVFSSRLTHEDFRSKNWLLAYEGATRSWFGWTPDRVDGSILELLAKNSVSFLDLSAIGASSIKVRPRAQRPGTDALEVTAVGAEPTWEWEQVDFDELDDWLDIEMDPESYGYLTDEEDDEEEEEEEELEDDEEGGDEAEDDWGEEPTLWDALDY